MCTKLSFGGGWVMGLALAMCLPQRAMQADEPAKPGKPALDRAALEKQFEETMSGATMIGSFTVQGADKDKPLASEKYTLGRVRKVKDDFWLFETRIQYGDHDVTLPLTLEVKWAGDTPVITLTDLPIPGLGTFTARVVVYRDEYAGTWSGSSHGGHLFGRIVREEKSKAEERQDPPAGKATEKK